MSLDYDTRPADLSLTELHRIIRGMQRRQRLVWLHHRAARLRVLKAERRHRVALIADRWTHS